MLTGLAWLLSENRRAVGWRVPAAGLGFQFAVALLLLKVPQTRALFAALNVALSTAANIFVGMVEAPLFIRAYLRQLTRGELFMVMCSGMASIMSAPASIMIAWLMVPLESRATAGELSAEMMPATSSMDAITQGTERGLAPFLNIVAMLIVLVALVQLANGILSLLPAVAGADLTLERMLGWLMAPVVWLMGG